MIVISDGVAYVREKPKVINDPCRDCAFKELDSRNEPCDTCYDIPLEDTLIYRVATLRDHVHDAST